MNNLQTTPAARHTRRARPLVMVTEDHDDTRFLFRMLLGRRGYAVIEARDGEEAVLLAESECPDLILMDANLPHLDGLEATRRIRRLGHASRVPIIFISGRAESAFRAEAIDTGCDEFLLKPLDFAHFDAVIEKHLGRKSGASATEI